jgi:acyl-CoA synthetase (NDP forming)
VSEEVDLLLVALAPNAEFDSAKLIELLDQVDRSVDKPMAAIGLTPTDGLDGIDVPIFTFPEEAAQVLGRHAQHGVWQRAASRRAAQVDTSEAESNADREGAGEDRADSPAIPDGSGITQVDSLLAGRDQAHLTMASPELEPLLEALDLPLAPWGLADDLDHVVDLAERIGYPVVLKAGNLASRSVGESGGAAIDLYGKDALVAAYRRMSDSLGRAMRTSVVQRMVASTGTVRLELLRDPAFGAMVAVGRGGSVHADTPPVARRFLPFGDPTAGELIAALAETGSVAGVDEAASRVLVDLVLRLTRVADADERVARVTMNPVLLAGADTVTTDADIHLRRQRAHPLSEVRHLSSR